MKKILWVSKHQPLKSQVDELKRLFGDDVYIRIYTKSFNHAAQITSVYREGYYDDMVLIAPLSLVRVITSFGIKPLYSQMQELNADDPRVEIVINSLKERLQNHPRYMKFLKFKRVERLEMVFSEIVPETAIVGS